MKSLAIGIPTCCRVAEDIRIGYLLEALALAPQLRHAEFLDVYIWDEGVVPIVSDRWTRLIIDLLGTRGHRVNYLRRNPSKGVAAARKGLLDFIDPSYDEVLLLDDDLIPIPGAIDTLLSAGASLDGFGFLQGAKLELDASRDYWNDINRLNKKDESIEPVRLYFGDAAFLLVKRKALSHVRWDIVLKFQEDGLPGEDVAISLMIADKMPCFGIPNAEGYHLSLARPRWRWETASDVFQFETLRGVVSEDTLKRALPHLAKYFNEPAGGALPIAEDQS